MSGDAAAGATGAGPAGRAGGGPGGSAVAAPALVRACRREPVGRTPIWLMRQAGRYLPEYRAIRERHTLLEICANPELTREVTLQPLRRFPLDAAIIFADILLPLPPMGVTLRFAKDEGPVIEHGVATAADVDRLLPVDVERALGPTLEALRLVRAELAADVALIGFAGAPFTLASYLIEGGTSRRFVRTKRFMYTEPQAFHRLMTKLAWTAAEYLIAQARAGADVLQVFDSWVGWLAPDDYRSFVLPHMMDLFRAVRVMQRPIIHFGADTGGLLELLSMAGSDVVGIDWRVPLDDAWRRVGQERAVQGNLDPAVLFAPAAEIERRAVAVLEAAAGRPGHIFNLGHGVLPETPVEAVEQLVATVRRQGGSA